MTKVELQVLGPLRVLCDATPVALGSTLRRRVLAGLALSRPRSLSTSQLAELVWPGQLPVDPHNALQTHVARLRRALPDGIEILTDPHGYRLEVTSPARLDADRFESLLESVPGLDGDDLAAVVAEALALWRGQPFADLDHPEASTEARRLAELRNQARHQRGLALLESGRADEAVATLDALAADEPLRESAVAALARALVACQRQAEALRVLGDLRRRLAEELGVDPSPAVAALEVRILRQEEAPALRTGTAGTMATGVPASSLVGRGAQVARAGDLLASHRLVTVTGPGGVGKTRLARHVAQAVADRYPGGVVFVPLAPVGHPDEVGVAVAAAAGLTEGDSHDLLARLVEVLSAGRQLLVLDDCERVIEGVAQLATHLGGQPGGADVLATSREPLRVEGEHVLPLAPLGPGDAQDLFWDRVRAAGATAAPSEADRQLAQAICRRLDGLPLALELAAARVPALGLAGLAEGLDRRFELLAGSRSGPEHHRSLHRVVAWSYDMLDQVQRQVLLGMSQLAGAAEMAAIASVAGVDAAETRATVAELAERSLVVSRPRADGAHHDLLDTVRAFGRAHLSPEQSSLGEEGLLRWSRTLAGATREQRLRAGEGEQARRGLDQAANLAAALGILGGRLGRATLDEGGDARADGDLLRVGALAGWLGWNCLRVDLIRLAETAWASVVTRRDPAVAELAGMVGAAAWQRGDLEAVSRLAETALAAGGSSPEARYGYDLVLNLALFRGDLDEARDRADSVIELSRQAGDGVYELLGLVNLGFVETYGGRPGPAEQVEATARRAAEALGGPAARGWVDYLRGERLAAHHPQAAAAAYQSSLASAQQAEARFLAGVARHGLVTTRARYLEPSRAVRSFRPLIDQWQRSGTWAQLWMAVRGLIEALGRAGRHAEAATLLAAHRASPRATPLFGADARALEDVADQAGAALGRRLEEALATGAAMGDEAALALARRACAPSD